VIETSAEVEGLLEEQLTLTISNLRDLKRVESISEKVEGRERESTGTSEETAQPVSWMMDAQTWHSTVWRDCQSPP
jgi:hypothetical protein